MADPLAEALNRVGFAGQQAQQPVIQEPAPGFSWKNVLAAAANYNPLTLPGTMVREAQQGTAVDTWRTFAGQLARVPTDIVGGLIGLPALADVGLKLAGVQGDYVPLAEPSAKAAEAIHGVGRTVGETIAGKPLTDSVLYGTPTELAANWARTLVGAVIPAPVAVAAKLDQAKNAINSGSKIVDALGRGSLSTLEALTPITISAKPSAKLMAVNATLAGALSAAVDGYIGPQTTVAQAKELIDEKAKGALDFAAQGGEEIQRSPQMVQAGLTGDPTYDAVGLGLLTTGTFAAIKRGAIKDAWTGVRNSLEKSMTGYDPANPVNKSLLDFGTKVDQQGFDRNAGMVKTLENSLKAGGYGDNVANQRAAQFSEYAAARSGASVNTRMQQIYNEGTFPDSRVRIAPVSDMMMRYRSINDAADQDLLVRALHSQRELDTRRIDKTWFHLGDTQTRELERYVAQVRANPQLSSLFDEYLTATRQLAKYTEEQKRFSSREVKLFTNKNPNFVPENLPAGERYLTERKIGMDRGFKTFEELGNPFENLPRYIDEVVRSSEGKKIQRGFMTNMIRMKDAGNPYASKVIGHTIDTPPPKNDMYVHWRNQHGESRWTRIEDAVVRDSLKNATNPSALQLANGFVSGVSRLYESGSVGSLAAVTGSTLFAPKSALYTTTIAPIIRDKGVAMGWIDRYAQDLTEKAFGKRIGVRGDWITMAPDVAARAAINVGAVMTQRMSRILKDSVISDGMLSKALGPQAAKLAGESLERVFKRSAVYDLQKRGVLGPASAMSIDPARSFKNAEQMLKGENFFARQGAFVNDILHAISSAPAMSVRAMNKGRLSENELSAAMRNMSGDPAKSGAFRRADGGAGTNWQGQFWNATPWGNIFLQAGSRLAKQVRKDPVGVASGVFMGVALPSISASLWNASLGPEYTDYQLNQRAPEKVVGSIYIGIPGKLPEQGVEIDIDPLLSVFKWGSEAFAAAQLGLFDNSYFKDENGDLRQAFNDMIEHRNGMGEASFGKAALERSLLPPVIPTLKTVPAVAGVDIRSYIDIRKPREQQSNGFSEGLSSNPNPSYLAQYMPAQSEMVLRSIGSGAFANIFNMLVDVDTRVTDKGVKEGLGDSLSYGGKKMKMTAQDSTRMFGSGPLFDSFMAISPSTESSGAIVKEKLEGLKNLQAALQATTIPGGVPSDLLGGKKQGGLVERMGPGPMQAQDEQMGQLAELAGKIYRDLANAELASNNIAYNQMQAIRNNMALSPQMKRALVNEQAFTVIDNNRKLLQDITRHEEILSGMFGRKVRFDQPLSKMLQDQPQ